MARSHPERPRDPSARSGPVREDGDLVAGLRHGVWRTWDEDGRLVREARYWRGEQVWAIEYGGASPASGEST